MKKFSIVYHTRDSVTNFFIKGKDIGVALKKEFDKSDDIVMGCDKEAEFGNDFARFITWIDENNTTNGFRKDFGITMTEVK
jgi:hypothetical protein